MRLTCLALLALCAFQPAAHSGAGVARIYSRSLILYPAPTAFGTASYILSYTTYDPKHDLPLYVPGLGTNQALVSSELKQRLNSSVYSTTYVFWQGNFVSQDGILSMTLPVLDLDRNRVRDMSQPELTFYTGASGRSRGIWPNTNEMRYEARFSRAAGELSGAYSGFLVGSNSNPRYTFTGELGIMHIAGDMSYERGTTNLIYFGLSRTGKLGVVTALTGSTTYTCSSNVVVLAPMRLFDEFNRSYVTRFSTLSRRGNQYVGNLAFVDGDLDTPWPDYTDWVLELVDQSDDDGNGMPDLSDPTQRPPTVAITVPGRIVRVSSLPITVRGTARDMSGINYVAYSIEAGGVSLISGFASGTDNWSIPVESLVPGTNVVSVWAEDLLGRISAPVRRGIIYTGD